MRRKETRGESQSKHNTALYSFAALIVIGVFLASMFSILPDKGGVTTAGRAAGDANDITVSQSTWDADNGDVVTKITVGKATVDSVYYAKKTAQAAKAVQTAIMIYDIGNAAGDMYVGGGPGWLGAAEALWNLNPQAVVTKILGGATTIFANAVTESCVTKAIEQGSKNWDGSVTFTLRSKITEDRNWRDTGSYYYIQHTYWPSGCKSSRSCMYFIYDTGEKTGCWF